MAKEGKMRCIFYTQPYSGEPGKLSVLKQSIIDEIKLDSNVLYKDEMIEMMFDRDVDENGIIITNEKYNNPHRLELMDEEEAGYSVTKAAHRIKTIERNEKRIKDLNYMKSLGMTLLTKMCADHFDPVWSKNGMDPLLCWDYLSEHYGEVNNGAAENSTQTSDVYDYKMENGMSFQSFYVEYQRRAELAGFTQKLIMSNFLMKAEESKSGLGPLPKFLYTAIDHILERNLDYDDAIEWLTRKDNFYRSTAEGKKWILSGTQKAKNVEKLEIRSVTKGNFDDDSSEETDSNKKIHHELRTRRVTPDIRCFNCNKPGHPWRECPKFRDDPLSMEKFGRKLAAENGRKRKDYNDRNNQSGIPKGKFSKAIRSRKPLRNQVAKKVQAILDQYNNAEDSESNSEDVEDDDEDAEDLPECGTSKKRRIARIRNSSLPSTEIYSIAESKDTTGWGNNMLSLDSMTVVDNLTEASREMQIQYVSVNSLKKDRVRKNILNHYLCSLEPRKNSTTDITSVSADGSDSEEL